MNMSNEQLKEIIKEAVIESLYISKEEKATLTIEECTKFTNIGRDKLMELAHNKNSGFPCFKVGKKFLVNRQMLKNWINEITEGNKIL